jgi:hypothetical protein
MKNFCSVNENSLERSLKMSHYPNSKWNLQAGIMKNWGYWAKVNAVDQKFKIPRKVEHFEKLEDLAIKKKIYYPLWLAYLFIRQEILECDESMFIPERLQDKNWKDNYYYAYEDWVRIRKNPGKIWKYLPRDITGLLEVDEASKIDKGGRLPILLYTMFWDKSNCMSPEYLRVFTISQLRKYKVFEGLSSNNLRLHTIAFFPVSIECCGYKF